MYCPLDLTTGLLGTHVWGVLGHAPEYSTGVVKNVLVWAAGVRERAGFSVSVLDGPPRLVIDVAR